MDWIEQLAQFKPWKPSLVPPVGLKKSAVLVPLQFRNGSLHVIMTVRSRNLSRYSGDISFPGGMQDPDDGGDFIKTALREAEEEISLPPQKVRVLCQLRPCMTQHEIIVVPVIGFIDDESFEPIANLNEVEECFRIRIESVLSESIIWKTIQVQQRIPYNVLYLNTVCSIGTERRVWGVTANIFILLLILGGRLLQP